MTPSILRPQTWHLRHPWTEDDIQLGYATMCRKALLHPLCEPFDWYHDPAASKRSRAQAAQMKAMGMSSGNPDNQMRFKGGLVISHELKRPKHGKRAAGRSSKEQREKQKLWLELGHHYAIYTPRSPYHAAVLAWCAIVNAGHLPSSVRPYQLVRSE